LAALRAAFFWPVNRVMTNSSTVCHHLLLTLQLRRFGRNLMMFSPPFAQTEQLHNRLLTDFEFVSNLLIDHEGHEAHEGKKENERRTEAVNRRSCR
jgi:hypothetical protein